MNRYFSLERLRSAWNVFKDRNPQEEYTTVYGPAYTIPQFKKRYSYGNEKSIVNAIYTRIAVDVSMVAIQHVRVDENKVYLETMDSGLNRCITEESNLDQTAKAFLEDAVMSMFDEGTVVLVPTDTSVSLVNQTAFDILSMRTAKVVQWYPHHVRLLVYNENRGEKEEITLHKTKVAIIENPFYSIMNEKNGILMRLVEKLNLLDFIDQQSGSGKLDLIIQFPFMIKSDARKAQAEARKKDLEDQLKDSPHGIVYTDGTEKITQLNRPVENNLMAQIEYLTRMLYGQLGISEKILDGTADEKEQLSYQNRVVKPIVAALVDEMKRKFLTKTARSQGQTIMSFHNLFDIVTPEKIPDLADKLTRNEIASPNDIRGVIGWKPAKNADANQIRNRNIPEEPTKPIDATNEFASLKENNQNGR